MGQSSLFGGLANSSAPHPAAPDPPISHTSASQGLTSTMSQGFDPIQSLLQQLQGGRSTEPTTSTNTNSEMAVVETAATMATHFQDIARPRTYTSKIPQLKH